MRALALATLALIIGATAVGQTNSPATVLPAALKHPLIPSHGASLLGVIYLAEGAGPHPTAILFHGFPGYEQNLDLAQALRAEGWNVLAYHYRGSWGTGGQFSFQNSAADADTLVNFALDPKNVSEYHIDPSRIVTIGHSMGGFMAASAAAHNSKVGAAVLISAWNIGGSLADNEADEAKNLARDNNLAPLAGTTSASLAHEVFTHHAELDFIPMARAIAPRPVLLVTADDHSDQFATPMAAALKAAGSTRVSQAHFPTDHPYSDRRKELIGVVTAFLSTVGTAGEPRP